MTGTARKRRRRDWLMQAQFGACCLCGKQMQLDDPSRDDYATMEHLVPRNRSKSAKKHDRCYSPFILLSHARCNAERQRTPVERRLLEIANALTADFVKMERASGFVNSLSPARALPE